MISTLFLTAVHVNTLINTWGFGRLALLCSPSSPNIRRDFKVWRRGVDLGEVRAAHAVLGEVRPPSNSRIARIVLVGGEKERVGDKGSM